MEHKQAVHEVMHGKPGAPDVGVDLDLADIQRFRMAAQGDKMRLFRMGPKVNEILPFFGYLLVQISALKIQIKELKAKAKERPVVVQPHEDTTLPIEEDAFARPVKEKKPPSKVAVKRKMGRPKKAEKTKE